MELLKKRLGKAIEQACQPQNTWRIVKGREQVLEFPHDWLIVHIEEVANDVLNLNDYWEYRRLLELLKFVDPSLLQRFVLMGIKHPDPDVREAAEDFQ